ncbi:hypothetical protein MKEN_01106100 [Mycena kentingensis (nom. inval.)]|nr:hypothetical protein MKEN_01106100 [Mycena kentingensis (nom. inval.)]
MFILQIFLLLFAARARALPSRAHPVTAKVIHQVPNGFFENIAVRADATLLLTSVLSPTLNALDPTQVSGTLVPVATFPNATSLTGIVELPHRPGVFAVAASVTNSTSRATQPGSVVIWSVDFTQDKLKPEMQILGALPQAASANGLTVLRDVVLAADSALGAIWEVTEDGGAIVLQDDTMLPNAPPPALGINGLHVRGCDLLYATSGRSALFRVPVSAPRNGRVGLAGTRIEKVADFGAGQAPDDFAVDPEGNTWVAVHPGELVFVPRSGHNASVVVGNEQGSDASMNQPTSAAFGRGSPEQERTLYVTTGVGQVVAVDVGQSKS